MTNNYFIQNLDFQRAVSVTSQNKDLTETQKDVLDLINELKFEIDAIYFSEDSPSVFLKYVSSFDNNTLTSIARAHRKIWNYRKILQLYVISETEIRIYNCSEKPFFITDETNIEKESKTLELFCCTISDKEKLQKLNTVFSRVAVDSGLIWTIEEAEEIRAKINIQRRIDKYLIDSLINAGEKIANLGLSNEIDLIHRLIMRSLFLLYLEDRNATGEKLYEEIKQGCKSYFDILEDIDATYSLFELLVDRFNGNVFPITKDEKAKISLEHLSVLKKCLCSGYEVTQQTELFISWRIFDFKIIQVELLSEIYENFVFALNPKEKENTGTYYTPPSLVDLILNEKLKSGKNFTNYDVKTLDPSCGSGIFLVQVFKRLVKRWENLYNEKLSNYDVLKKLLLDNIYGVEINAKAIKVAAFSLYLALLENVAPPTLWQYKRLPYLINDIAETEFDKQGKNLFRANTITEFNNLDAVPFALLVGNPPFGKKNLPRYIIEYCNKYNFESEYVIPFLHKATILAPNAEIALVFTTKVLTNIQLPSINFRQWLFKDCYVEKVYNFSILRKAPRDFGGQLFGGAVGPSSIVFYSKKMPQKPSDKIVYYAPKTYIKTNIIEGIVIDNTDINYLPREECAKSKTKIWKTSMWGGMEDIKILEKVNKKYNSLGKYINENKNWVAPQRGVVGDSARPDFIPDTILLPDSIERFYTSEEAIKINKQRYRLIDSNLFIPPYVVIKKGFKNKKITSSYIPYKDTYVTGAFYVFNGSVPDSLKKGLISIFNSEFITYYLFLTSSSWGIEREQIFLDEIVETPALIEQIDNSNLNKIVAIFDEIVAIKSQVFGYKNIEHLENQINDIIYNDILKLSDKEQQIIKETLKYSLDLFENKDKSFALSPVSDLKSYAESLCDELNDFLGENDSNISATLYRIGRTIPLAMVKLTFTKEKKLINYSDEDINRELKNIDENLYREEAKNIYFRKKFNYYDGDSIFIVRPNQKRFWSQTMAIQDASELIVEIINMNSDNGQA